MKESSYFVYMVACADGTLYTGSTNDLDRRVEAHNASPRGARYTKARRPVSLAYSEACAGKGEALRREHAIKRLSRQAKLELIASCGLFHERVGK